jgi:hypothetical protein
MSRTRSLLVVALVFTGACKKTMSMGEFAETLPGVYCDRVFSCCNPTEARRLFGVGGYAVYVTDRCGRAQSVPPTVESCRAQMKRVYETNAEAVGYGFYAYDAAHAAACVASLRGGTCADLVAMKTGQSGTVDDCALSYQFRQGGEGFICFYDGQCFDGLVCAFEGDSEAGVCRPVAEVPNSCPRCPAGQYQYCDYSTGGQCLPKLADGAPCSYDPMCSSSVCWSESVSSTPASGICGLPAGVCQGTQTDAGESTVDAEACEPDTPAAPDSSGVDAKDVREGDPLVYCRQGAACTGAETCVVDCHGSIAGLNLSPHMECSCVDGLFACTVPPSLVDTTPPPACPADTSSPCDAQCRVCVFASDPSKASRCFCSVEGTWVCGG